MMNLQPVLQFDQHGETSIAAPQQPTPRQRAWLVVRDFGPLTPAAIAERMQMEQHDVRKLLVELHVCRFIASIRARDPVSGDEVTMAEVAGGMAYDDAYAERTLARYFEQMTARADDGTRPTTPRPVVSDRPAFIGTHSHQRRRIVDYLRERGSATCDELAHALNIDIQSLAWRMKELREARLIRKTGGTRPTRRGKAAHLWELRPRG